MYGIMQLSAFDYAVHRLAFGRHRRESQHTQQSHHKTGVFVRCQAQILTAAHCTLVIQLNLFVTQILAQTHQGVVFGIVLRYCRRHRAIQRQFLQQQRQLAQGIVKTYCPRRHILRGGHQRFTVLVHNALQQFIKIMLIDRADHVANVLLANIARTHRNRLIEQAQGVAHRTHRSAAK